MARNRKNGEANESGDRPSLLSNSTTMNEDIATAFPRWQKLHEEKTEISAAMSDLVASLADKFDLSKQALAQEFRMLLMDPTARQTIQRDRDTVRAALGGFASTPLGTAAVESAPAN